MADIIDGKAHAAGLRAHLARRVAQLHADAGFVPGLAVVLVGEDPASQVYVRNKAAQTRECGMQSIEHRLPASTTQDELLALVATLNADPEVDGILVQLPVPAHIDPERVLLAIDPAKDVDGFHPLNAGLLATGGSGLVPCTPLGSLMLLKDRLGSLAGLHAVVVGRSNIVGKPMAQLLLREDCTVSVVHSRTREPAALCRQADIVVAAVGRPRMIGPDWVKPGATVIDVGINRISAPEKGEGKSRLVGDVAYEEAAKVAGAITPVPGGVGPMTIAMLMANTVASAYLTAGRKRPSF